MAVSMEAAPGAGAGDTEADVASTAGLSTRSVCDGSCSMEVSTEGLEAAPEAVGAGTEVFGGTTEARDAGAGRLTGTG
jgi:hypothetical protein